MTMSPNGGWREAAAGRPPFDLARLIHPLPVEEFLSEYWEKKPLHLRREDPDYYSDLLTLNDMDQILSTSAVRSSDLRVLSDGKEIPVAQLTSPQTGGHAGGLEALFDAYRKGATINLTFLHERYEPLAGLCRSLALDFSSGFQTNVYLTPGGKSRGLNPHYDTHDVFVVQAYGSKHWHLYKSDAHLPLASQPFKASEEGAGDPVQEFDLETGDLLYLPRGTMHEAVTNMEASLHLTIGVLPILWASLLRDAVELAIGKDSRLRESLPLGFAIDENVQTSARSRLAELLDDVTRNISVDQVIGKAIHKALLSRQPMLRGHLLDLESLECVELETPVHRRPELQWKLIDDGDRVILEFHGKTIGLPAGFADELRFVTGTPSFTGRDIPGPLDDSGRLTLIRTLLREGFLTLA